MSIIVGVDVGQRHESSAVCVVEYQRRNEQGIDLSRLRTPGRGVNIAHERTSDHFTVRHLERIPAGKPYLEIARRVGDIWSGIQNRGRSVFRGYVDLTGLGDPVLDLLTRETRTSMLTPVYFTHGDRRDRENGAIRLGKAWLVSRLQTLFQGGTLHMPRERPPEYAELIKDLLAYEPKLPANANELYGAFRVGRHDDMVTALGLAVQERPASLEFGYLADFV